MKKIGFVDYYISEWHANNYPGWITEISEKLGLDDQVAYVWAEKDISEVDGKSTDDWCREFGVQKCATLAELCEKSDCIIILSPSNPEKHLEYCAEVFPYGKRTYVDKTFAPDLQTAKEIVELAKKYSTPFFSTSALRYAEELRCLKGVKELSVKGGGRNLAEYIIHQIEMVVKVLGIGASELRASNAAEEVAIEISYADQRKAQLHFSRQYQFSIEATDADGNTSDIDIQSDFFKNLIEKILLFFENGETDFDAAETLEVMKLREGAIAAAASAGCKL